MSRITRYSMMRNVHSFYKTLLSSTLRPTFGYIDGHSHLTTKDIRYLKQLIGTDYSNATAEFETSFSRIVGAGESVSFASARMAFFSLLSYLKIGKGDEVILLGSTCSVMPNAIIRTGAQPVYSDLDIDTFGSSVKHIEECLSSNTRMIVAQHSFGIPCDIEPIAELALSKKIFLLEDCALTLGSMRSGKNTGTFGNAALYSTDHSKPINTLTGGLIYSDDTDVIDALRVIQRESREIPIAQQRALWRKLRFEARYCVPQRYGRRKPFLFVGDIVTRLLNQPYPLLTGDSGATSTGTYPYPARLPTFLAALGVKEIERWQESVIERRSFLNEIKALISSNRLPISLPKAYCDVDLDIVPLRIAWAESDIAGVEKSIEHFVDIEWTWFKQPIINTTDPLEHYGYCSGSCSISEEIGPRMVNLPCNLRSKDQALLIGYLVDALKG